MNHSTPASSAPLALRANAVFSAATGLLLAAAPATVGEWLGVSIDGWLRLFGISLLGHAAVLGWAATSVNALRWARINLAMIAPYPFALIALIVAGVIDGDPGRLLAGIDAAVIAGVTVLHLRALGTRPSPQGSVSAAVSG